MGDGDAGYVGACKDEKLEQQFVMNLLS